MLPSTLELLRDILREAEFLESEAQRTSQAAFPATKSSNAPACEAWRSSARPPNSPRGDAHTVPECRVEEIAGLRDRLVHDYAGVEPDRPGRRGHPRFTAHRKAPAHPEWIEQRVIQRPSPVPAGEKTAPPTAEGHFLLFHRAGEDVPGVLPHRPRRLAGHVPAGDDLPGPPGGAGSAGRRPPLRVTGPHPDTVLVTYSSAIENRGTNHNLSASGGGSRRWRPPADRPAAAPRSAPGR